MPRRVKAAACAALVCAVMVVSVPSRVSAAELAYPAADASDLWAGADYDDLLLGDGDEEAEFADIGDESLEEADDGLDDQDDEAGDDEIDGENEDEQDDEHDDEQDDDDDDEDEDGDAPALDLMSLGSGTLADAHAGAGRGADMENFAAQLNMMTAQMAHVAAMCKVNPSACGLNSAGTLSTPQAYGYDLRSSGLGGVFPDPAALRHAVTGPTSALSTGFNTDTNTANNPLHTPHWYGKYPSYMDPKLAKAFEDMRRDDRHQWRVGGEPFSVLDGGKQNPVLPHGLRLASAMPKNTYPDPGFYPQYYRLSSGGF